jgi:hypothetical protein
MYQTREDGRISNLYNVKVINKTTTEFPVELRLKESNGEIQMVGEGLTFNDGVAQGAMFILLEKENLSGVKTNVEIEVVSNGEVIEVVKTNFMGPTK